MKTAVRKLLSLLLALAMLGSLIPFAAMAAEGDGEGDGTGDVPPASKTVNIVLIRETDGVDEELTKAYTTDAESVDVMTLAAQAGSTEGFTFVRYDAGSGVVNTPGNVTIVDGMTVYIRVSKTTTSDPDPDMGETLTTVRFMVGEVEHGSVAQTEGEAIRVPEAPEKEGYEFEGWFAEAEGKGQQLVEGAIWHSDSYPTTVYAYFTEVEPETNTVRLIVKTYVGETLRATQEQTPLELPLDAEAFAWLGENKENIAGLLETEYPGYSWDPQTFFESTGAAALTEENLTTDGGQAVCVKLYSEEEATVRLHVYRDTADAAPTVYELGGYLKDDSFSRQTAETEIKKHFTGTNLAFDGLYNDAAWEDLGDGETVEGAESLTVPANADFDVHVIVLNADKTVNVVLIKVTDGVEETLEEEVTTAEAKINVMTLAAEAGSVEGYTFVRYDAGKGQFTTQDDIDIVHGMTVYIRVSKTTQVIPDPNPEGTSVKFIVDSTEFATIKQTEGRAAVLPATPQKTGYSFEGWYSRPNGQGHRISGGSIWYDSEFATTYYAHFVSNAQVDLNTIRIFVQRYVGDTLKATFEIDSVRLESNENAFDWLYYNKDRIDALVSAAYPEYDWAPQVYYDYSGQEPLTQQNLTANGTKSVCIKIHTDNEANVLLYVYPGKATATPGIYELGGYQEDDTVSLDEVKVFVKNYYTGKNIVYDGLYNDEAWQDLKEGKDPTAANGVTVENGDLCRVHIILKNASVSTADPSNPKTGDYILPAAATLAILSGTAAAAVYFFGKKRRA